MAACGGFWRPSKGEGVFSTTSRGTNK
jgi:hypothetical protein